MRHIILHYHLFKNAGTSVDTILKKRFGEAMWGGVEGTKPWDTLDADAVHRFARDNPQLQVISSHQARLPEPVDPGVTYYPLLFLRHPIDRIGSVYYFEHREAAKDQNDHCKVAAANDLAGYVRWRLSDGNGSSVICNFQTVCLAGRERDMRTAAATKEDLLEAKKRLYRLPFFGIVELFDESLSRMRSYLLNSFGDIGTNSVVANKSPERNGTLEDRLAETKAMLGADLYQELLDRNAFDLELYNEAVQLFKSRGAA